MRILLVTTFFPPVEASASLRTGAFARAWREAGEDVTVLTTPGPPRGANAAMVVEVPPRLPWVVRKARAWARGRGEAGVDGAGGAGRGGPLARWRARTGAFTATRMPDVTGWWIKPACAWAQAAGPWDVVVASFGPYAAPVVGAKLKRAGAAHRLVLDYRDLWSEHPVYDGVPGLAVWERRVEARCLAAADLVTTVCEPLRMALARRCMAPVRVVYNGFDDAALAEPLAAARDGVVRLVHTGTIYPRRQDPGPLLEAMARVRRARGDGTRLELHLAGPTNGPWREAAARFGVADAVRDHGVLPRAGALALQASASACVVLGLSGEASAALPGKFFEALTRPVPVLVIGGETHDPMAEVLAETGCGVRLPGDASAIAATLETLLDGGGGGLCARRDPAAVARYDRRAQAAAMLGLLRGL